MLLRPVWSKLGNFVSRALKKEEQILRVKHHLRAKQSPQKSTHFPYLSFNEKVIFFLV